METIPPDVRSFIQSSIPTVGHMEALLLALEAPGTSWSIPELAKRLYVTEVQAEGFLRDLTGSGLLHADSASPERWRYAPATPELDDVATRAGRTYRQRLVAVTNLIHSRTSAARQFSDAFRFWRK